MRISDLKRRVRNNPNSAFCIAHVRPYTEFSTDLTNDTVAQYVFITPNLCDDMHDSCAPLNDPVKQGDTWLSNEVPKILNSTAYLNGRFEQMERVRETIVPALKESAA